VAGSLLGFRRALASLMRRQPFEQASYSGAAAGACLDEAKSAVVPIALCEVKAVPVP
jgi:hypothetical protein